MKTYFPYILILLAAAFCLPLSWAAPAKAGFPATVPVVTAPVVVVLTVEKQILPVGKNEQPMWQPLGLGKATVLPGDILRYTVTGSNRLTRPLNGFALTQPIPRGTEYRLHSSSASGDARMTASLDGGKTYAEKPTVRVTHPDGSTTDEPAPVSRYTTLRWTFLSDLPPMGSVSARCEVRVR